jgi:hypothetical protein
VLAFHLRVLTLFATDGPSIKRSFLFFGWSEDVASFATNAGLRRWIGAVHLGESFRPLHGEGKCDFENASDAK